jgi:FixJ family two-component response regulator
MQGIPSFIAVIDDDESMCQALGRLLHLAGYAVRSYFSAESFLDDPDHARTRFLVADIQLQGMSGFDLQRTLRHEGLSLPIAFITAHDEPATRTQANDSGCVAYLRKPFPSGELLEAISSALAPSGSPSDPPHVSEAGNHTISGTSSVMSSLNNNIEE